MKKSSVFKQAQLYFFATAFFSAQPCSAESAWSTLNSGLNAGTPQVDQIALNPADSSELFANTTHQLYKSVNHAKNWAEIGGDLFLDKTISSIVYNPKNAKEIYVATLMNGIYKSNNGGQHWERVNDERGIYHLLLLPLNNGFELFATTYNYIFKSSDAGLHWNKLNNKKVDFIVVSRFGFPLLGVNPVTPSTMLFGAFSLYYSTDFGVTWNQNNNYDFFEQLSYCASCGPNTAFAIGRISDESYFRKNKLLKTTNNGQTWQPLFANNTFDVTAYAVDQSVPQEIYVAVDKVGIYKSQDFGRTWVLTGFEFFDKEVSSILISPANHHTIYVGTKSHGIYRSINSGKVWNAMSNELFDANVIHLAVDHLNPNLKYASLNGKGLWVMRNGKTWEKIDAKFVKGNISQITLDPKSAANVAVIVTSDEQRQSHNYLYISKDYGHHWQQIPHIHTQDSHDFNPDMVVINPNNTSEWIISCKTTIWKSVNSGDTWNELSSLLTYRINKIVFNPDNSNEIYIIGNDSNYNDKLYKSTDGGKEWFQIVFNHIYVTKLFIDSIPHLEFVAVVGKLFDGSHSKYIYRSNDSEHWNLMKTPLSKPFSNLSEVLIDPKNPQHLYAKYHDYDKFPVPTNLISSCDGGESWIPIDDGIPGLKTNVTSLQLANNKLYAGTTTAGVWERQLSSFC